MNVEAHFMARALELAELGLGTVKANPMVGCVVVHKNKIIGEGYHQKYGEAHAEVNAIKSVKNKDLIKGSTVYVTLEPCSHFGKTPPCASLLIKHKPLKVVVATLDPNPLVSGKGIKLIEEAEIKVEVGLLHKEARLLNKRFFTFQEKKRPYIILKWAETANHKVATLNKEPLVISDSYSQKINHKFRSQEMAILVGAQTVMSDNPSLTTRHWKGDNPIPIVLDSKGSLDSNFKVFENNEVIHFKGNNLEQLLKELHEKNISSLLVEGGPSTHKLFIEANLFDEIRVFRSPNTIEKGLGAAKVPDGLTLITEELNSDLLFTHFQPFL